MEEYLALSRKDLFIEISPKEIQLIHSLLLKYIDNLVGCRMQMCGPVGMCGRKSVWVCMYLDVGV